LQCKCALTKSFPVSTTQRKFPMKARVPFAPVLKSIIFKWSCRLYEFAAKVYFRSSVTTFAELKHTCRYHCELHTNEFEMDLNYQQLRLRLSHFSVLVEQNSLLKSFVRIICYTSTIRNAFAFHKLPNIHFCEHFLQISHNLRTINTRSDPH